jgi:EmrB/QacA subfamily drug resistance transporter
MQLARRSSAPKDRIEPHVRRVMVVVVLGMIMSILDTTIVNVALDSLSRDLHSPLSSVQWVVSAYLLALAAVIPLTGWAVRRYGAFQVFMLSLVMFTVGSGLCAVATSIRELIIFRALQGIGGGLLLPTGMTLLVQAAGRRDLPRVMAAIGVPMVMAPVFGPTLGGLLLQSVGWHAIFVINLPIGVVTFLAGLRMLPRDRDEEGSAGRLDWQGLLLAGAGTVGITYGLSESATAGTFTSGSVLLPIFLGVVLLVVFVLRSKWIDYPLLDLKLYRLRAFASATVVMFCLGGALYGALILLPLYFQVARGEDAIVTGLLLIPQGIGAGIGMNRSAAATSRFGAGLTSMCGGSIMVLATVPFLFVGAKTSFVLMSGAMVVRGVGVGLAMMPAMTAAFSVLDHDQVNDASPQLNVIQRVGGSLGTAVVAVILQDKLNHLGAHASANALAAAFGQTYVWVIGMSLVALIPAVFLWRIERRTHVSGHDYEVEDEHRVDVMA